MLYNVEKQVFLSDKIYVISWMNEWIEIWNDYILIEKFTFFYNYDKHDTGNIAPGTGHF